MPRVDLLSTLEQLENEYWGEPGYPSHLVITCHQLRQKPLRDFTIEDLRIMIGQNISLDILVPLAMERLHQNIMAEGNCYPGDLLQNVVAADPKYWEKHPDNHRKLVKLYKNNLPAIQKMVGYSIHPREFMKMNERFDKFAALIPRQ